MTLTFQDLQGHHICALGLETFLWPPVYAQMTQAADAPVLTRSGHMLLRMLLGCKRVRMR